MKEYFPSEMVNEIVRETGTPVYVYSLENILKQIAAYKKAFHSISPLFCYAMKANSNLSICRLIADEGFGADVVSGGELFRALKAGFEPGKIIFSGVGKRDEELSYALKQRILFINVESFEELKALEAQASRLKIKAPFSVRINPDVDPHTHKYITTGKLGTKFGVPASEAFEMYEYGARSPWLRPVGIHSHLGSQLDSPELYSMALRPLHSITSRLAEKGIMLTHLDIGGGWGVPEGSEMRAPSEIAGAIKGDLKKFPFMRLILEPGRSIVAFSGALAVSVLYRKKSGRKDFAIVDGAMNDLIRPSFYGARHPVRPLVPRGGKKIPHEIVGPVCETGDFLASGIKMARPEKGDVLLVMSAGAYGFSMSSNYNSRPRAAEALITPDGWRLIRRRETLSDLVSGEI